MVAGMSPELPVPPVLLQEPSTKTPSKMLSDMAGLVAYGLTALLSAPNKALGKPFLTGNFAPVHTETFVQQLPLVTAASAAKQASGSPSGALNGSATAAAAAPKLVGTEPSLPAGLCGALLRIGPNPLLAPLGGYHWFDGDGMMHAVRMQPDGSVSYCNRWVPTARLNQEVSAGWPLFIKLGDHVGLRGLGLIALEKAKHLLGLVDKSHGGGTANTAMVCHASRLLALHEGDLPYAMRLACNGLLEAVGRLTVSGPVGGSFTAHPKLDPATDELHFFRYTFDKAPYVSYGVLGPSGELLSAVDLGAANIRQPSMMHDFAITKSWAVFLDNPLRFDGERMVKDGNLPFTFRAEQGSRVGLLPRGAKDDAGMVWFRLPPHMVFHVANAWEEADGTVKLFVCHTDTISLNLDTRTSGGIPAGEQPHLACITLDPSSPISTGGERHGSLRVMTEVVGDFPQVNTAYVARKSRWAYVACMVTGFGAAVKFDGVAKLDLESGEGSDACAACIRLPPGCYCGEAVFVPRHADAGACSGEDDGWLLTHVTDEAAGASFVVAWDATSMDERPAVVVQLPQRVPYGFHALWLSEAEVQRQLQGQPLQSVSARAAQRQ